MYIKKGNLKLPFSEKKSFQNYYYLKSLSSYIIRRTVQQIGKTNIPLVLKRERADVSNRWSV